MCCRRRLFKGFGNKKLRFGARKQSLQPAAYLAGACQGLVSSMAYRANGRRQSEPIVKELKVLLVEDSRTYALALSRRLEAELRLPIVVCQSLRVGLEKASTISIPCETPGEQADVGDGYPGFC